MTRSDLDARYTHALYKPFARWLVDDSTQCPRCLGPRDAHIGCDCKRNVTRALLDLLDAPEARR